MTEQPATGQRRPRPVASDSKPWEPLNTDQRPNLSSYEILAACGMIDMAHGILQDGMLPDPAEVLRLAGSLLRMADRIQTGATGGRPDRMVSSHTRARGFLRTTVEILPPPMMETSNKKKIAWCEAVVAHATALLYGAAFLIHGDTP